MELRRARIFATGMAGLTAVVLFSMIPDYVLLALAVFPLLLLVVGQFYLPRSKRAIRVWFNPCLILNDEGEWVQAKLGDPAGRLSGKDLSYGYFKQWHEFGITTHRHWLLAAVAVASMGASALLLRLRGSLLDNFDFSYFYFGGALWLIVLFIARRWLWERRILRREGLALGGFGIDGSVKARGLRIRYHFVDHEGEHRGGIIESMACARDDDMTIVFYDEADPEKSFPASALMFHKLAWGKPEA